MKVNNTPLETAAAVLAYAGIKLKPKNNRPARNRPRTPALSTRSTTIPNHP